jgi:ABC-type siderophore export system fused ATPase/permease subunit
VTPQCLELTRQRASTIIMSTAPSLMSGRRIVTLLAAVFVSLSAGTNYVITLLLQNMLPLKFFLITMSMSSLACRSTPVKGRVIDKNITLFAEFNCATC